MSIMITNEVEQCLQRSDNLPKCTLGITFKGPYLEYMSHGPQHVYMPQDRVGHSKTMFTGHHDYSAEDFMQDAGAITNQLILACLHANQFLYVKSSLPMNHTTMAKIAETCQTLCTNETCGCMECITSL